MPDRIGALTLSPGTFGAQLGDDLVLLDLSGGRYLCLSGVTLVGEGRVEGADALLDELVSAGLASRESAAGGLAQRPVPRPARSIAPSREPLPGLAWTAAALRHAALSYWGRPMSRLVMEAARRRGAGPPSATSRTLGVAARFRALAPYLPLSAKCLLRSFLLLRRLRAEGSDAVWVFGVRTWPFGAHCWLQAEDVVLDDDWERVAGYVPILAV